jgi:tRNA(fMet)-specific endonuclease VapC
VSALVVDSSSWVSYFSGEGTGTSIESALEEGRVYLPPVVAAELGSGKLSGRRRRSLESFLRDLLLVPCDFAHWLRVGKLRSDLRSLGLSISTPDAHVAQCALDLGADLLTEDAIFTKIAKRTALRVIDV